MELTQRKFLNSNQLKWIAIICMLVDHVAWAFVPIDSILGQVMHTIGRITAPIMFFFIAEGYYQTKDLSKYLLRLFIFAMISWIPFSLFSQNRIISPYLGIMLTMFLGLYSLFICKSDRNILIKVLAVFGLCFLSIFGDWQVFGVLYILAFGLNRQNFKKQVLWFCVVTLMMILTMNVDVFFNPSFNIWSNSFLVGVFLPLPLIYFYNGKRGGEKHKRFNKWFFYIFYPAHLLIIWAIGLVLS